MFETFVDAAGHSYLIDGTVAYVTVYGTTYTMTVDEARACWATSARARTAAVSVEAGRRSLRGW